MINVGNKNASNVQKQLTETTQKTIPALRKLNKYSQYESSEIITYLDGTLINNNRFTVSNVSPYSVNLTKTSELNPAYFTATPYKLPKTLDYDYFEFVFSTPNIDLLSTIELRIVPDASKPTEYYNKTTSSIIPFTQPPNTKIKIRVHRSELSVTTPAPSAGLALTSTGYMELRTTASTGFKMKLFEGIKGLKVKSPAILQFDDGHISVYEKVFPRMKELGIVGTFNVVATWIGLPDRCTVEQLKEMQNAGWSICNHSNQHLDLQTLTEEQVILDLEASQKFLAAHGFSGSKIFAPPFNSFNATLEDRVRHLINTRKYGTRSTDPLVIKEGILNVQSRSVMKTDTPAGLISEYQAAAAEGKYFSVCFHNFEDVADPSWDYSHTTSKFLEFLDLLVAEKPYTINMETYREILLLGEISSQPAGSSGDSNLYKVAATNSYTATSLITDFPDGCATTFTVNTSGAVGFPNDRAGLITTYRIGGNGWYRQDFRRFNSNEIWSRYADQTTGAWTQWLNVSGSATGTTAQRPTGTPISYGYYDQTLGRPVWNKKLTDRWVNAESVSPENRGINVAVSASATFLDITFPTIESDTAYAVVAAPSWNTTWWKSNVTINGVKINFGTAPSGAGTLDWKIFR